MVPLPFVNALLSHNEQTQYTAVLHAVEAAAQEYQIINFGPRRVLTDFEKGILNANKVVYLGVTFSCCFFHLKQS